MDSAVWPIPVIISGLPVVAESLNAQTEERQALRNRFNVVQMRSMTIGQSGNLADAVVKYCEMASLKNVIHKDFALGKRLTHASNYAFGMGLRFARLAAARAAPRPERQLTSGDFADAYAVKLGCSDAANPFKISDWRAVDASLLLAQSADQRRPKKAK